MDISNSLNGSPAKNDFTAVVHGSKSSLHPSAVFMKIVMIKSSSIDSINVPMNTYV